MLLWLATRSKGALLEVEDLDFWTKFAVPMLHSSHSWGLCWWWRCIPWGQVQSLLCRENGVEAISNRFHGWKMEGRSMSDKRNIYTPKVYHGTWKWWFPKGISFSRVWFSGSMLNFRGVSFFSIIFISILVRVLNHGKWPPWKVAQVPCKQKVPLRKVKSKLPCFKFQKY